MLVVGWVALSSMVTRVASACTGIDTFPVPASFRVSTVIVVQTFVFFYFLKVWFTGLVSLTHKAWQTSASH